MVAPPRIEIMYDHLMYNKYSALRLFFGFIYFALLAYLVFKLKVKKNYLIVPSIVCILRIAQVFIRTKYPIWLEDVTIHNFAEILIITYFYQHTTKISVLVKTELFDSQNKALVAISKSCNNGYIVFGVLVGISLIISQLFEAKMTLGFGFAWLILSINIALRARIGILSKVLGFQLSPKHQKRLIFLISTMYLKAVALFTYASYGNTDYILFPYVEVLYFLTECSMIQVGMILFKRNIVDFASNEF